MHVYDIAMLTLIVAAAIYGGMKGLVWQLTSLASLGVSYFVALNHSASLAPHLSDHTPWNRYLAMLILFLATSMCIWLAFRVVAGAIDRMRLKEYDRQMGALFGGVKGLVWCLVITFFAVTLSPEARTEILEAKSGYCAAFLMDRAHAVMPDGMHEVLEPYIHQLDETLPDRVAHSEDDDHHHH